MSWKPVDETSTVTQQINILNSFHIMTCIGLESSIVVSLQLLQTWSLTLLYCNTIDAQQNSLMTKAKSFNV